MSYVPDQKNDVGTHPHQELSAIAECVLRRVNPIVLEGVPVRDARAIDRPTPRRVLSPPLFPFLILLVHDRL